MEQKEKEALYKSIAKKAAGYRATETQEEYALVDGEMTLVKRKVTQKDIPPDVAALRLLLGDAPPEPVSREELEREREALQEAYFLRLKREQSERSNNEKDSKRGG